MDSFLLSRGWLRSGQRARNTAPSLTDAKSRARPKEGSPRTVAWRGRCFSGRGRRRTRGRRVRGGCSPAEVGEPLCAGRGGSVGGRAGIRATWGGRDGLQLGGLGVYSTWRGLWKTQRRSLDPLASREPCPPECGSMCTPQASRGWLTVAGRGRRPGTSGRGLGGATRSPGVCGRRACW